MHSVVGSQKIVMVVFNRLKMVAFLPKGERFNEVKQ